MKSTQEEAKQGVDLWDASDYSCLSADAHESYDVTQLYPSRAQKTRSSFHMRRLCPCKSEVREHSPPSQGLEGSPPKNTSSELKYLSTRCNFTSAGEPLLKNHCPDYSYCAMEKYASDLPAYRPSNTLFFDQEPQSLGSTFYDKQCDLKSSQPNTTRSFESSTPEATHRHQGQPTYFFRHRQFPILIIQQGSCVKKFVHTAELLRIVLCHNRGEVVDDKPGCVKLRDLRQICFSNLGGQRASIETRRNCILFNLVFVRCIMMHRKVILLPQFLRTPLGQGQRNQQQVSPEEGLGGKSTLLQKLMKPAQEQEEVAIIEALFSEVCSNLTEDLIPITHDADALTSDALGQLSSAVRIREMSLLKRRIDLFTDLTRSVHNAIRELLDNDNDVRRLEVGRFWDGDEDWENPLQTTPSEDMEILLEFYEQEVESMLDHIHRIDESVEDILKMIQLHLASIRNTFLKSELGLDIVGTFIAFVAAIAGIFGMNLP